MPTLMTVAYKAKFNNISITTGYAGWRFKIMTPADILSKLNNTWFGDGYDIYKPDDLNEVLGNLEGNSVYYNHLTP